MSATLAEPTAVPFHLGLSEPIDEATIVGYPSVEGAYDPVEQVWKLPAGTSLTDPQVIKAVGFETQTWTYAYEKVSVDDFDYDT
jgi:hypothetical protein